MENAGGEAPQQLEKLAARVLAEIDSYKYEYPEGMIGHPLSEETVRSHLEAFRSVLIAPYWADVKRLDTVEQLRLADPPVSRCAVVADDTKGTLLAFDPAKGEFLLAMKFRGALESFGVNGDAVGCFMAR